MAATSTGYCYVCGVELGKIAMKNHVQKIHGVDFSGQECRLLKIEGAYDKDYWLYIDIPMESALSDVDSFLRKIWLECCGHLSAFRSPGRSGHREIAMSCRASYFAEGEKVVHEYDFGSTTESLVTFMGSVFRKRQRGSVRLLARNAPSVYKCNICDSIAEYICQECIYTSDNPFYCERCSETHVHQEMLRAVTNSPRMGECGYEGELDTFTYVPKGKLKE